MTEALPKILVVDDTAANLVAMRRLLAKVEAQVIEARSGEEALRLCLDHRFALILLDVQMPEMDGFEVAEFLAGAESTRQIPIIFVTAAFADDLNRLKGYQFGAVDYIAKPVNDTILLSKVRVFLELDRAQQRLRELLGELESRNAALQAEVAERQRAEAQVRHQALHDPLTGLPNRRHFMEHLDALLARRRPQDSALIYIDIDGFKPVNDTHGHGVGDQLLQAIAQRLRESARPLDINARLGGDEFALVLDQVPDAETARGFAERLCQRLREPYALDGVTVSVGASIGVAMVPGGQTGGRDALIQCADTAMYAAKRGGRNQVVLAD
ncbi:MAG TPA: diguanylate cyclase [Nevskiaceae bacterium]|nr:diguanylate cyclase [Nevskiaceae bacterium]